MNEERKGKEERKERSGYEVRVRKGRGMEDQRKEALCLSESRLFRRTGTTQAHTHTLASNELSPTVLKVSKMKQNMDMPLSRFCSLPPSSSCLGNLWGKQIIVPPAKHCHSKTKTSPMYKPKRDRR